MLVIPVIVLSFIASFSVVKLYPENSTDFFTIPKMSFCWLLPNILFSAALGMVLTEILSQLMAVFVQGVLWVASVMGSAALTGDIGRFTLVCRHNSLYERSAFMENFNEFLFNRIFYTVLAIAIMVLTTWIYSEKRKGGFYVGHKNFIRKSKI